jgi:hypothetical protein
MRERSSIGRREPNPSDSLTEVLLPHGGLPLLTQMPNHLRIAFQPPCLALAPCLGRPVRYSVDGDVATPSLWIAPCFPTLDDVIVIPFFDAQSVTMGCGCCVGSESFFKLIYRLLWCLCAHRVDVQQGVATWTARHALGVLLALGPPLVRYRGEDRSPPVRERHLVNPVTAGGLPG